ncbi:hypothetical protein FACS1894206_02800 [Deltaproteobacteria bacterium]|nr:hypothetical protein FACS1894206_02800 [Deltaproteobacteria bacterium]
MADQFIGVYATNEQAPSSGEFPRNAGKRKRLWFAWETPEGRYKVQALNAILQPMAKERFVTRNEFTLRFKLEKECPAVPEGYVGSTPPAAVQADALAHDDSRQGIPILTTGNSQPPGTDDAADDGRLQADDPNLLMNWVRGDSHRKKRGSEPIKIPFDRLVGEVIENSEEVLERKTVAQKAGAAVSSAADKEDAENIRLLRSQFVHALLLLRRGEREESITLLQGMLEKPYAFFEEGAQLFSEFGLGLRRLGLIPLALGAHKRALEFAKDDARILFNIARSYHDLDHVAEAKDFLERALAVAPDFAAARQFLTFLQTENTDKTK